MPSTEASTCRLTTQPTANTINPAIRVKTARPFSSGCRWPSLFSVRWERGRALAASRHIGHPPGDPWPVEEDCSRAAPRRTLRPRRPEQIPRAGQLPQVPAME